MLNTTHFFIAKISSQTELEQTAHLSYISNKDFINIYRKCTSEPYSFLVDDTTLAPNNPLRYRENLFGIYNKKSWQLMIRLEMKKYNMILIKLKYHLNHQAVFTNINILLVKKYYHLISIK